MPTFAKIIVAQALPAWQKTTNKLIKALVAATAAKTTYKAKAEMKRKGNLYQQICSMDNLRLADAFARKHKKHQSGIKKHDKNPEANLTALRDRLLNKTYTTSRYRFKTIHEPKERVIAILPYIDRIVHHAIMIPTGRVFVSTFTADTYASIKGKGVHRAAKAVKHALEDVPGTTYCLKLDIRKFYPNVDHDILKMIIRRKIKDNDLIWLLDDIIDSAPGLPIGNYMSAFFANLYLMRFDHWIKEDLGIKNYFRYMDDIVILAPTKDGLHVTLAAIRQYFADRLKLSLNRKYQVFPVAARGINFVGFVLYHTHTLLRPSIKKSYARAVARKASRSVIAGYKSWAKKCDCRHLQKKLHGAAA